MKKLDLNVERYIVEEKIFPESKKSATYIYPEVLKDNSLLKYNISEHSIQIFDDYFNLQNKLSLNKEILDDCFFEEEEKIIKETIFDIHDRISYKLAQINESISPFYWDIYKNADMYSHEIDHYVKDDYVLILKYKKEEPDE